MGEKTTIEWTDSTWNPVRGCALVSAGCAHCYAMKQAHRFSGPGQPYEGLTELGPQGPRWTGKIRLVPELLNWPLKQRKPLRIFVNSMSDLFHENVPASFIVQVFEAMAACPRHTFQILTKRPERIEAVLYGEEGRWYLGGNDWLPNVWLGVSVEDQQTADERIPLLLQTPAAVRFVSYEPALGPVNFALFVPALERGRGGLIRSSGGLDWIICGGESGPGARPMHPAWARSVRDQCHAAGVPFFFKQWGAWYPSPLGDWKTENRLWFPDPAPHGTNVWKVGKKAAGRLLDGRTWDEFPTRRNDQPAPEEDAALRYPGLSGQWSDSYAADCCRWAGGEAPSH